VGNEFSAYIGDLDTTVTDDDLYQHFKQRYMSVLAASVIMDPATRKSKRYGFVRFSDSYE
jgi:RNA recognition motif-containing protein